MSAQGKDAAFLREAARFFESLDTHGEDRDHWANVYNAENFRRIADRIDAAPDLLEALEPFVHVRDQYPQSIKIIQKKLDGLTPITVTVTKDQFLAALDAISKANPPISAQQPPAKSASGSDDSPAPSLAPLPAAPGSPIQEQQP